MFYLVFKLLFFVCSISGELPFCVECTEGEDEDEKLSQEIKKCKWDLDAKAFARCTSEVKKFITALLQFDVK